MDATAYQSHDREWTIEVVTDPAVLVANSHVFDEKVSLDGARDFCDRPGHLLVMAFDPDECGIGFASGVEMRHPDKSAELFVYELGVEEEWRARGVATSLLRALTQEAGRRGCAGVWTATEPDNVAALATYARLGATAEDSVVLTWSPGPPPQSPPSESDHDVCGPGAVNFLGRLGMDEDVEVAFDRVDVEPQSPDF